MEFKENLFYEIYLGSDDENFDVGFFIAKDDENVIFQSVNVNGFDDGLILLKIEDIYKVQYNTKYCEALEKLIQYHQVIFKKVKFNSNNLIKDFLQYAKNNKSIVEIELNNSDSIDLLGFIDSVSDDYFTTTEVGYLGFNNTDGNAMAKINDISIVHIDAYKHLKHKILLEINAKFKAKA